MGSGFFGNHSLGQILESLDATPMIDPNDMGDIIDQGLIVIDLVVVIVLDSGAA
jgi:hypothetical protein